MSLDLFLSSDYPRNQWMAEKYIKVYVRKSNRYIQEVKYEFLDLASVEVCESQRGKGIFSEFFSRFEKQAKKSDRGVYVESILEKRFVNFFSKLGYKFVPNTNMECPTMYKLYEML